MVPKWKLCCVFFILLYSCQAYLYTAVPAHLQDCYRRGGVPLPLPRRLDVLIAIVRKLEETTPLNLNMRLFTSSLLRNLRVDGIEKYTTVENDFILPYRASAFQFHRFKLLMDFFVPSQPLLKAEELLTVQEKCLLHRMLSSTVRQYERGDERTSCVEPVQHTLNRIPYISVTDSATRIHSKCPVEEGVVQTEWGTIAPGMLFAALSCALDYQRVQVTDILTTEMFSEGVPEPLMTAAKKEWMITLDDISNVLVATIVGDLSEVVIHQGSKVGPFSNKMVIGTLHSWNNTLIPMEQYLYTRNASLPNEHNWHFTDAEILAGIDGLILADLIRLWVDKMKTLKLSHVIEMYYSDEGIHFDPTVKACNRKTLFSKVFDKQQLYVETVAFSHLMALHQLNHYISVKDVQALAEAAVSAFSSYLSDVIHRNHRICEESSTDPVLDLIVATDSSWDGVQVQQFMSWIAQALRLGYEDTTMSVLHGTTGQWIVPPVNNIIDLFNYFDCYEKSWPSRMNIPAVLDTVIQHCLNKTLNDIATNITAGPRTLILLISPEDHPSNADFTRGKSLMQSLRTSYFDVFFAYLSQDLSEFDLEDVPKDEFFLSTLSSTLTDVITTVDAALIRGVIPKKIVGTHCPLSSSYIKFQQELHGDSVLPYHAKHFRIHSFYLRERPVVNVHFRNSIQGRIRICTWRGDDSSRDCRSLIEDEKYNFKFTNPCRIKSTVYDLDCPPINFLVAAKSSSKPCDDDGCRLPSQVRFFLRHSGLKCLRLHSSQAYTAFPTFVNYIFLKIIINFSLR